MRSSPKPANEAERLAALRHFEILDTLPQQAFDDITLLASSICDTPIALISLVDSERQWFKSRVGLDSPQTPREVAFCSHAILRPSDVMVVSDASRDERFRDNPLVTNAPDIRFYAGAPIVTADGLALGTVCVIDRESRTLSARQVEALRSLSRLVITLLEHDKRRRDEELAASAQSRQRTEYLLALTAEGLDLKAFVDREGVYRYVNNAYLHYWNRARDAVEGLPVVDVEGEDAYRESVRPHLEAALAGRTVSFEKDIDFPGRGRTYCQVTFLPARGPDGTVRGAVIRVHDIQRLKEREDQLRATVSTLERRTLEQQRFIHIVSHDLREPINTIVNFSSLLAEDHAGALPAAAQKYLAFVRSGGERMKALLDDLIAFVRLGDSTGELRPTDLGRTMQAVSDDLAMAISRSGGSVRWQDLPVVTADPSLIRIVLQNLVANALKFARRGVPPDVRIDARPVAGGHEIRVTDNGIGIPADKLDAVFDLFRRLNLAKDYAGTGLGLSICRRILERHGGRIRAESVEGEGSRFTFFLPDGGT